MSRTDYAHRIARQPTSHDVARLAGVSQPTVSLALRDDPRVAAATRARVREAAASLAYIPSGRGRSLATRRTGQVAIVVSDLGNPFYMEAIEHLHGALEAAGRRVVALTDRPDRPVRPDWLLDGSIDGAVLTTTRLGSTLPHELTRRGLPIVLFNRSIDAAEADVCESDNASGAELVAALLAELGHERIGAILGPQDTSTGRDREAGLRSGLAAAGRALDPALVRRAPFSAAAGHRALGELLDGERVPTAVFCANDVIAVGALNAARSRGIAVPEELTVLGFDDIAMSAWEVFALSTVRQDIARMAAVAAGLLAQRLSDPARPPERVTVSVDLVLRGSHGPPSRSA